MKTGELKDAQRRALNLLDQWLEVTGVIPRSSGYYYELQGLIEDAVHCGAQAATKDFRRLESEEDMPMIPGWHCEDTEKSAPRPNPARPKCPQCGMYAPAPGMPCGCCGRIGDPTSPGQ